MSSSLISSTVCLSSSCSFIVDLLLFIAAEQLGREGVLRAARSARVAFSDHDGSALRKIAVHNFGHQAVAQADVHFDGPDEGTVLHPEDASVVRLFVCRGRDLLAGRTLAAALLLDVVVAEVGSHLLRGDGALAT